MKRSRTGPKYGYGGRRPVERIVLLMKLGILGLGEQRSKLRAHGDGFL